MYKFAKFDRKGGERNSSEPWSDSEDIGESEPCRKPEPYSECRRKKRSEHTQESSKHHERDERNDQDIGKRRDDGNLSEIYHKNRKSENHRGETHGKRFSEPEPLRKKRKYSCEKISKKQESEDSEKREMKAHIEIENGRIIEDESESDGDEEGKRSHLFSGKEDGIRDESECTRPQNRHLRSDEKRKKPDNDKCEQKPEWYRKWAEQEWEKYEDNRDIESAHRDDMGKSRGVEMVFCLRGEIRPLADEDSLEEFGGFPGIDVFYESEELLASFSNKHFPKGGGVGSDLIGKGDRGGRIDIV